ncbi:predicted protein [Nematostella vectensis]|uniref:Major facilitator superfamily associated domain-containing protein n=1 Tax=Nematostella vectensis TaxID=45351 RepID=A7RI06_NEMVE|nr:major facilitator superfamily domain-containing protein 6 [Nematostella vectensis]EDO49067.1 predicted protein [Nematostella vectensis]|eukprot:XP_001641130.1 predicted protein [Nematostella vectensis]
MTGNPRSEKPSPTLDERRASEIPLSLKKLELQQNGTLSKVNKTLLFFKYFYFVFYSAIGTVFPFLNGYIRQIGISNDQMQILSGVRPLIHLVFAPLWGVLGDRCISKKMIIQFSLFVWLVVTISMAFLEPTGQTCQVISINQTIIKVVNSTEVKTGFFRRKRSIIDIEEYPMDYGYAAHAMNTRGTFEATFGSSSSGSGSHDLDSSISGSGTTGSGDDHVVFKTMKTHENLPTLAISDKARKDDDVIITTRNLFRSSSGEIYETFLTALVLLMTIELFLCPVLVFLDSVLLNRQHEDSFSYGQQRLFGSLGYVILFLTVGVLLERSARTVCGDLFQDYVICFCFFCFMTVLTLVVTVNFDIPYIKPDPDPLGRLKATFYDRHHGTLLASVCFMGFSHSVLTSFYDSYLLNSGVDYTTTVAINVFRFSGEPIAFFLSSMILNRAGTINVLFGIILVTSVNLFCSSFISGPWHLVSFGFVEGFTYGTSWVAMATYLVSSAPTDSTSTVQGVLQSVYWGLGGLLGVLIGNNLISMIGSAASLRLFSVMALVIAIIFTIGLRGFYFSESNYFTAMMTRVYCLGSAAKCVVIPPGKSVVDSNIRGLGLDVERASKSNCGGKKDRRKSKQEKGSKSECGSDTRNTPSP